MPRIALPLATSLTRGRSSVAGMAGLTQERLKQLLRYDPDTWHFWWIKSGPGRKPGRPAGCVNAIGYVVIRVDDVLHTAHRLAWLYMTGAAPAEDTDHADRNRANNAWANLREASRTLNNANAKVRSDNKSGFKGVAFCKRTGRYEAYVTANGKRKHLGRFETAEDAHGAYREAAALMFGRFANFGNCA